MDIERIVYKYTERNLLEEPENYFFSEYAGSNFVKAYFNDRLNTIEKLKCCDNCKVYNNLQEYLKTDKQNDIIEMKNKIVSIQFLKVILEEIINNNIKDKKKYLDMFLKKYEVTKKIFNEYDNDFKAAGNEYRNIKNYCLLSICCSSYYKQTKKIKYINTSMKINDMLCSKGIMIEDDNAFLIYTALDEEVGCINELFLREGFSYEIN